MRGSGGRDGRRRESADRAWAWRVWCVRKRRVRRCRGERRRSRDVRMANECVEMKGGMGVERRFGTGDMGEVSG